MNHIHIIMKSILHRHTYEIKLLSLGNFSNNYSYKLLYSKLVHALAIYSCSHKTLPFKGLSTATCLLTIQSAGIDNTSIAVDHDPVLRII